MEVLAAVNVFKNTHTHTHIYIYIFQPSVYNIFYIPSSPAVPFQQQHQGQASDVQSLCQTIEPRQAMAVVPTAPPLYPRALDILDELWWKWDEVSCMVIDLV